MIQTVNDRFSLLIRRGEVVSISFEVELGETIAAFGGDANGIWIEGTPCVAVGNKYIVRIPHNECGSIPRVGTVSEIGSVRYKGLTARSLKFTEFTLTQPFEGDGYLAKIPDMRGFYWRGITSNKPIGTPSPANMKCDAIAGANQITVTNGDLSIGDRFNCQRLAIQDAKVISVERSGNKQRITIDQFAASTVQGALCDRVAGSLFDWTFTSYTNDPARWTVSTSSGDTALPSSKETLLLGTTEFYLCCGTETYNPKDGAIVQHLMSLPTYLLPDLL